MNKTPEMLNPVSAENAKPDPKRLFFCCPECGSSLLSQVMTVRLFSEMDTVYDDGTVEEGYPIDEEVEEVFYECNECLYPLQDASGNLVRTQQDLVKWLKANSKITSATSNHN